MEQEKSNFQEPVNADGEQQTSPEALSAGALYAEEKNIVPDIQVEEQEIPQNNGADTPTPAPEETPKETFSKSVLSYLRDFVMLLAGIVLVFSLLFRVVVVSGPSMKNTLYDGDYILLLNSTLYSQPQPGDIVVACKDSFQNGEPIIKRVIATAGQKVDIDFHAGIVYVDDVPLDEPYTLTPTNLSEGIRFPLIVEEGCVFVMGDNRNHSMDSRSKEIGLIDQREILGKALFLIFPGQPDPNVARDFNRIGALW